MRQVISLAALLALAGCTADVGSESERLVRELMGVWGSGDVSVLERIMAEDVVYEDVPNGVILEGVDGAAGYVGHVHTWASGVTMEITRVAAGPDSATAEWVMRAVQSSPIPGRVPVATGAAVEIHGLTTIDVRRGRIVRAADYLDALGFVLQLGAEVTLPGGVRLPPDAPETGEGSR